MSAARPVSRLRADDRVRSWRRASAACAALVLSCGPAIAADRVTIGPAAVELGPAPIAQVVYTGRISAIAASRTDADYFFVSGADGGVWRTTDGGASYTPLTGDLPTSAIGALALDPTDEQIIYAGSGEAHFANHSRYGEGIYKSSDGGDTWSVLAREQFAGRCFSNIVIDPTHPQRLFAGVTRAGGFPEMAAAKRHPQAEGPVGLFRSEDGGHTWTHLSGLPALSCTGLAMDPADPDTLYAGIGRIFGHPDNGLYKSTDGGESWTRLGGGLPTNHHMTGRITVAVAPSDPERLYTMITRAADATGGGASMRGAYRSDDGGETWINLNMGNIQATYGWYLSVVAVKPNDPDEAFFGGLTLVRTRDAGETFTTVTPPHVDIHRVTWNAAGNVLCATDGGVYRSPAGGGSWVALNNGLGTIQFYAGISTDPFDPVIIAGGTQDNGTNMVRPNGAWRHVQGGDGGWTQIHPTNGDIVFCEFQGTGNLFRSTDGGRTFVSSGSGISASDRNCFLPPYLYSPLDFNLMVYATHRLYLSTNGGQSWIPISGDLTGGGSAAIRSLARSRNAVWAATNDGRVVVSRDGGLNFDTVMTDHPGWARVTRELACDPNQPGTAYLAGAVFGAPHVQRTRDFGGSWETLDGDLPDVPVNTIAIDRRATPPVLYAGSDVGVFRSLNDGANWTRYGQGLPRTAVIDLLAESERGRLLAATQGRGMWEIPLTLPGDLDFNGWIDLEDLLLLLSDFGCQGRSPPCAGDVNGDGEVGYDDLLLLLNHFSQ